MEGLFLVLDALLKLGSMRTRRRELDLGKRNRDDYKTYKIRQQWGQWILKWEWQSASSDRRTKHNHLRKGWPAASKKNARPCSEGDLGDLDHGWDLGAIEVSYVVHGGWNLGEHHGWIFVPSSSSAEVYVQHWDDRYSSRQDTLQNVTPLLLSLVIS